MSVHRVSLITSEKLAILDCNLLLNLQQTDTLRTSLLESLSYLFNVCGPSLKDLAKYLLPQNIMIVKASKQTSKECAESPAPSECCPSRIAPTSGVGIL